VGEACIPKQKHIFHIAAQDTEDGRKAWVSVNTDGAVRVETMGPIGATYENPNGDFPVKKPSWKDPMNALEDHNNGNVTCVGDVCTISDGVTEQAKTLEEVEAEWMAKGLSNAGKEKPLSVPMFDGVNDTVHTWANDTVHPINRVQCDEEPCPLACTKNCASSPDTTGGTSNPTSNGTSDSSPVLSPAAMLNGLTGADWDRIRAMPDGDAKEAALEIAQSIESQWEHIQTMPDGSAKDAAKALALASITASNLQHNLTNASALFPSGVASKLESITHSIANGEMLYPHGKDSNTSASSKLNSGPVADEGSSENKISLDAASVNVNPAEASELSLLELGEHSTNQDPVSSGFWVSLAGIVWSMKVHHPHTTQSFDDKCPTSNSPNCAGKLTDNEKEDAIQTKAKMVHGRDKCAAPIKEEEMLKDKLNTVVNPRLNEMREEITVLSTNKEDAITQGQQDTFETALTGLERMQRNLQGNASALDQEIKAIPVANPLCFRPGYKKLSNQTALEFMCGPFSSYSDPKPACCQKPNDGCSDKDLQAILVRLETSMHTLRTTLAIKEAETNSTERNAAIKLTNGRISSTANDMNLIVSSESAVKTYLRELEELDRLEEFDASR